MARTRNKIPERTIKLLFARAAFCAFPGCRKPLSDRAAGKDQLVAQVAHIAGLEPGSARHDRLMTPAQRDAYDNLILLCPTHHLAYVDSAPDAYTVAELQEWKRAQERWVEERMLDEMPRVSFAELEVVMKAVATRPGAPATDLTVVPPAMKMEKNALTRACGVMMGLTKANEVRELLQKLAEIDAGFSDRLRAGFLAEYDRLHAEGARGDALFFELRAFAASGQRDLRMQDAALAVLSYLFEACDVFER